LKVSVIVTRAVTVTVWAPTTRQFDPVTPHQAEIMMIMASPGLVVWHGYLFGKMNKDSARVRSLNNLWFGGLT
jgi:hypothetical protein